MMGRCGAPGRRGWQHAPKSISPVALAPAELTIPARITTWSPQQLSLRLMSSAVARCWSEHRISGLGTPRKIKIVLVDQPSTRHPQLSYHYPAQSSCKRRQSVQLSPPPATPALRYTDKGDGGRPPAREAGSGIGDLVVRSNEDAINDRTRRTDRHPPVMTANPHNRRTHAHCCR
jgi:hypothetical protein